MNAGELNEFFDMLEKRITDFRAAEKERDALEAAKGDLLQEKKALEAELNEARSQNLHIMENQKNWTERVRSLLSKMEAE